MDSTAASLVVTSLSLLPSPVAEAVYALRVRLEAYPPTERAIAVVAIMAGLGASTGALVAEAFIAAGTNPGSADLAVQTVLESWTKREPLPNA